MKLSNQLAGGGVAGKLAGQLANKVVTQVSNQVGAMVVLAGTGVARPVRPDRALGMGLAVVRWGITPAAGLAAGAARYPNDTALIDDLGSLTYRQMDEMSSAIATGLRQRGVVDGAAVGVLLRNSRWFLLAFAALAKAGADVVLLNTGFGAEQLGDVCVREGVSALILDEEFEGLLGSTPAGLLRVLAWQDGGSASTGGTGDTVTMAELAATRPSIGRPSHQSRAVILTSGTTGTPKGAPRGATGGIEPAAAILSGIPLKARGRTVIAAPLFHSWGMAHLGLALLLSSTIVVTRKFDPEKVLQLIEQHKANALAVVPVMMSRMLELDPGVRARYDTSSLKVVAASGSKLPGDLSSHFMDAFGDVVYNLYGSTEVAYATVASPRDLREAPGTAGRVLMGTTIKLIGDDGNEVPRGQIGRIFVGNPLLFEGYTGGEDKDRLGDLMASGDIGRFDDAGRLFIEGRDDEMIISGGENVYPGEVEELLAKHPKIREVAVVGVEDETMGQRLHAYVVPAGDLTTEEVKAHVKDKLARHKVPRDVTFVDELPRNATGKVLKRELGKN